MSHKHPITQDPTLGLLHINVCVYEIVSYEDNTKRPQHLFKQVNNTIYAKTLSFSEKRCTRKDLPMDESKMTYFIHPFFDLDEDQTTDWVIIEGIEVYEDRPHPNNIEPIIVPADITKEEEERIKKEALRTKYPERPFVIFIPRTPDFMFDASISHVPPTAVTIVSSEDKRDPALEEVPEEVMADFQNQMSELVNK